MTIRAANALFVRDGFLSINVGAVFTSQLEKIRSTLVDLPDQHWTYILKNRQLETDLDFYCDPALLDPYRRACLADYEASRFSFFFRRLVRASTNANTISAILDDIYAFCDSPPLRSLLGEITERSIGKIDQFYVSRFDKGDFLHTHCDSGNNIGIALNLTREWDPNFGGLTHILDSEQRSIISTLLPRFAELFIFDTSARKVPHFVSMVTANPQTRRISLIARYDK